MESTKERRFPNGSKVILNSGGPLMTVADCVALVSGQNYRCTWFDDDGKLQDANFFEEMLSPADGSSADR